MEPHALTLRETVKSARNIASISVAAREHRRTRKGKVLSRPCKIVWGTVALFTYPVLAAIPGQTIIADEDAFVVVSRRSPSSAWLSALAARRQGDGALKRLYPVIAQTLEARGIDNVRFVAENKNLQKFYAGPPVRAKTLKDRKRPKMIAQRDAGHRSHGDAEAPAGRADQEKR